MKEERLQGRRSPALGNVEMRCCVSKRVMLRPYEPYEVAFEVKATLDSSSIGDVTKRLERMYTEMHNLATDAIDSALEAESEVSEEK